MEKIKERERKIKEKIRNKNRIKIIRIELMLWLGEELKLGIKEICIFNID